MNKNALLTSGTAPEAPSQNGQNLVKYKGTNLNMAQNKVFVNVNSAAADANVKTFRKLVGPKTKLFAVVKSNAYGHGLVLFSKIIDKGVDGFCVDSVIEGIKLREIGIKKTILVLGPTFKQHLKLAKEKKLTITISNLEALQDLAKSKSKPNFHLKIDTGMHRQGFYLSELPRAISIIKNSKFKIQELLAGVYTHFASAKDINYPTFTDEQFKFFQKSAKALEKAGFKKLVKHASATGGALVDSKYHLDAVRIGIGLYGLWPTLELSTQLPKIKLKPVLSWHALISEVKNLKPGDFIGYDLTERVSKPTKMAILPIGYWHGYPRALSSIGEVLVSGKRSRILGRVSMDLIAVDVTGIKCERGTKATLLGKGGPEEIKAYDIARKLDASHYEIITRINPLIERILK